VSIDKLKAIYNAGHSNPEQFTFIFSGNLKPDSIKSLVEKYLGSIHSDNMTNLSTVIKDKADSLPVNKRKFYEVGRRSVSFHSNDPKSGAFVYISSQGGYDSIRYNGVYATLAQNMFVRKCESIIRGKYANAYSVAGFPDKLISMDDPYNCQIVAYFKTNSTVAKKMKEAAVQTLKDFMMGKMDEQEFNNQKMRLIENRQNDLKSNYWWVNTGLHKYYFKKKDIITSYINEVSKITISDLKAFCKDIYSQGNLIDVMMTTER
jgi:zinc protease